MTLRIGEDQSWLSSCHGGSRTYRACRREDVFYTDRHRRRPGVEAGRRLTVIHLRRDTQRTARVERREDRAEPRSCSVLHQLLYRRWGPAHWGGLARHHGKVDRELGHARERVAGLSLVNGRGVQRAREGPEPEQGVCGHADVERDALQVCAVEAVEDIFEGLCEEWPTHHLGVVAHEV